jgi:cysteinyl-tRNA synthetase
MSARDAKNILNFLKKIDEVFGFIFWQEKKKQISKEALNLAKERDEARKNKDWQKSDQLRKEIEKLGYKIQDTDKETIIK